MEEIRKIEELYHAYKFSFPSESETGRRSRFKALKADEMSEAELIEGGDRYETREQLEQYVESLKGIWKWPFGNHWYWVSETDPDLVLLREWFE